MKGQQVSHYRLTELLGAGTYGEVWKGVHVDDPAFTVAVKLVSPHVRDEPNFIAALRRECRALDRMDHPSIVRFRELVVRDGMVAMVMELLEGDDLEAVLATGPQPVDEVMRILDRVLGGLAYAHSKGVLHRDIKPGNIFRCRDGRVKLMDFGIARAADGTNATKTGTLKGTLDYMAPERFRNETPPASDVYAVGLVAWELLAGRRAAPDGDLPAKLGWHMMVGPGDVRAVRPDCPAWLADFVGTLSANDASARPPDGTAAQAMFRSRQGLSGGSPPPPQAPGTVEVQTGSLPPPPSTPPSGPGTVQASMPSARPVPTHGSMASPSAPGTVQASLPPSSPAPRPSGPGTKPSSPSAGGGPKMVAIGAAVPVLLSVVGVGWFVSSQQEAAERREQAAERAAVHAKAEAAEAKRPAGYAMVAVPAGSFTMGSPSSEKGRDDDETQHRVTLTQGFLMGKTEVTQGLWRTVMGSNPSEKEYKGVSLQGDSLPVQNVSWCDAVAFANKMSAKDGLGAAYTGVDQCKSKGTSVSWDRSSDGYRLPTEAEWEYAARAGKTGLYAGGVSEDGACRVANVSNPRAKSKFGWSWDVFACNDNYDVASPVGSFAANPWGLHDMTGNVWEWCWDWYGDYSGTSTDPVGPQSGSLRVRRGGSWNDSPRGARVAVRYRYAPGDRYFDLGLRLVRTSP